MRAKREAPEKSRWGPDRRIEFIDFRLLWDGTVNRKDIVDFFCVSIQQASADLARYARQAPGNMEYDKNAKTYRATKRFRPLATHLGAQYYLNDLVQLSTGTLGTMGSMIGWHPPHELVAYPVRPIKTSVLLQILWAIRDRKKIEIQYQSMRMSSLRTRWITPHSLVFDGNRWHARAWCDETSQFSDFVISRIQDIGESRLAAVTSDTDDWWNTSVEIVVEARDGLTNDQSRAIEIDFGMDSGRLIIRCRKALAYYHLRHLGLERLPDVPPVAQPLWLMNRAELAEVIAAAQKVQGNTS